MRIVLDANVLIAAVAGRGLCESLLELCLAEHDISVSEELLEEEQRQLVKKIRLPEAIASAFCDMLMDNASMAAPSPVPHGACRDPKDLYLLGLAQSTQADFLITGDKDLLDCEKYGATLIVTPRGFWEKCRKKSRE